jgi:DNA mismatch repair protein MLH1
VTVNDGGLKLLQIKDNGCGIHPDDLPILCHRHTTSKIATFDDLASVGTLGFRGEALCSISFVSRLSITTMQPGAEMGFRADYRDSEMVTPAPEPCAAVPGTCIQVEDLFYNVPNRRKAMKSGAEEFKHIVDVVSRYAVYCTGARAAPLLRPLLLS